MRPTVRALVRQAPLGLRLLDPTTRTELEHALRRVAQKLLHQPTVRVKELASRTGVVSYAEALAELFALDPKAVEAVTSVESAAAAAPLDDDGGAS